MKTEPTEAYKRLRSWWFEELYDDYCTTDSANEAIEIAFQEGQSSPKIKQLEWTDHLRHYFVDTPFGVYLILRNHKFEENESWTLYFNSYVIDGCIDSDRAQEVAQADFEKRVKKCLE